MAAPTGLDPSRAWPRLLLLLLALTVPTAPGQTYCPFQRLCACKSKDINGGDGLFYDDYEEQAETTTVSGPDGGTTSYQGQFGSITTR